MKVLRQKSFMVFTVFTWLHNFFICKFKMALFKYGFKRKYVGFHKSFIAKVCVYNLPRNFSASKLLWYMVLYEVSTIYIIYAYTYIHTHTHIYKHTHLLFFLMKFFCPAASNLFSGFLYHLAIYRQRYIQYSSHVLHVYTHP